MTLATAAIRFIAATTLLSSAAAFAAVDAPPTRIRGDIAAVDAGSLTVKRRGTGELVKIALKPDIAVGAVKNVRLADIGKDPTSAPPPKPGPTAS
jgi:hypothetical protein